MPLRLTAWAVCATLRAQPQTKDVSVKRFAPYLAALITTGAVCMALPIYAQQLELPAPSPAAKVAQRVGLTDVGVEYSSPGVKGRTDIWGGVVPWDKPWRAGANAATKLTFSRDVTFGGIPVKAGTYSLVLLPNQKAWTAILSKDLGLWIGGKSYDIKDDVARAPAKTEASPFRERLAIVLSDTTDNGTRLDLQWEKLTISVPIAVDTDAHVQASMDAALGNTWRPHANAARYLADVKKDYPKALKLIDTSLAIETAWYNTWIKADILAKTGNFADAHKLAQKAWDLGQKDPNFFYKDQVAKALVDWKGKK